MKTKNEKIIALFNERYTCKGYDKDKKVSDEDFMTIIEAGRLSPSSFGYEPWKFILLKDREVLEKIKPYSWGAIEAIEDASHFLLILARTKADMQPESDYIRHIHFDVQDYPKDKVEGRKDRYREFLEEDFKVNQSERTAFDWTSKQTYIPLTSMLLTAAALNIDSTPVEGFHQDQVHKVLVDNNVYDQDHFKIATMVAFGYSNRNHREKTRQTLEEVYEEY